MATPSPTTKAIVSTENAVPPLPVFCVHGTPRSSYPTEPSEPALLDRTRALENLSAVLTAAGSGLEHILKANVYLANMPRDFATMNEAYIKVGIIKFGTV
ncbi:hypothetical protein FRC11_014702 [Ceratobasidium sp. 423]|nr:hypothetical protein FRC11_014702 [Ceratobasidium sp. 423]